MQSKVYINNIINKLTRLQYEIKAFNNAKLFDTNKISENILKDILNIIYGWSLINANTMKSNISGFDLIDTKNKILIQVSTTFTKTKLENSLNKEIYNNYLGYNFKFLSLIMSTNNNWTNIKNPYNLNFDLKNDLIDFDTLFNKVQFLDIDKLEQLSNLLDKEIVSNLKQKNINVSILAEIINSLSEINLNENKVDISKVEPFRIQDKINFNNLIKTKYIIDEYYLYSPIVSNIYEQYDIQANNKSFAVLQTIKQIYNNLASLNKYSPDKIYDMCKNKIKSLTKNSSNLKVLEIEVLLLYIDIILVDAFMRCKIFKEVEIN
ncbi:ABC-three component system protein [Mycoplasma mycoides]|uniref:ABC-three component system protein n=1 Tax=Mycoplasma mycoides TaxID=2102 RepID=UPI00223FA803|nr:ABC-three component system protein [Mycoplasma mycoides]QVK05736.1 SMEK domain-containing protein [Mycoplasma mycoides subsp. capri]QVK08251.1 SMEK domain-containing protein [Mycoplasma mycoides subsp. capri]QVK09616.1 SMEK domain-containing protein [Mycoplasma mycoides subsp. capri]